MKVLDNYKFIVKISNVKINYDIYKCFNLEYIFYFSKSKIKIKKLVLNIINFKKNIF